MGDINKNVSKKLGELIVDARKAKHLSQAQLADGICAQSMISSLENGQYIPNAILFAEICAKLELSIDHIVLSHYPDIEAFKDFGKKIEALCNQHEYQLMLDFLKSNSLDNRLIKSEDFQIYYYYYAVALEQAQHKTIEAIDYLKLALNYTYSKQRHYVTSNELLILATLYFLQAKNSVTALTEFDRLLTKVQDHELTQYDENTNVPFYLYAYRLIEHSDYQQVTNILEQGIAWTTQHNSHYMLADMFYLLAVAYEHQNANLAAQQAKNKSDTLAEIFNTPITKI